MDMYEDKTRPKIPRSYSDDDFEEEYDDCDDDESDLFDDDDDYDDIDDYDELDEDIRTCLNPTSAESVENNQTSKTIKNNIKIDLQNYDCAAVIDGKVYNFNDGEEPPEVLKMIEDLKKETEKIREKTKALAKAREERHAREMEKLKKEQERLKKMQTGTHKKRRNDPYGFFDDDDDYDRVVYIDEDEVDSFGSHYEESAAGGSSEPMLYGGLPFGDGQIYFEDDGDGFL